MWTGIVLNLMTLFWLVIGIYDFFKGKTLVYERIFLCEVLNVQSNRHKRCEEKSEGRGWDVHGWLAAVTPKGSTQKQHLNLVLLNWSCFLKIFNQWYTMFGK